MDSSITCPHCGRTIEIAAALRQDVEAKLLATERAQHQKELEAAKREVLTAAEARFKEQYAVEAQTRQDELAEQRQQNTHLRAQLVELTKQQRELLDRDAQRELAMEQKLLADKEQIERAVRQRVEEESRLKLLEYEKKLQDASKEAQELKQKLQQGSQQNQGEVLELELEQQLTAQFPFDEIKPVPKGITGADLVQTVRDQAGAVMGTIVWELKNTKNWAGDWTAKLKHDQRAVTADLAVIVSTVLPAGVTHFGHLDGVWVTDRPTAIGVAAALRLQLRQVYLTKRMETGKQEKAEILYAYLCSPAFTQRVEAMVEAYDVHLAELEREKRWFATKWARQEKAVRAMLEQTHGMYGDLQGIIGKALPDMKTLALPAERAEAEAGAATDR